MSDDERSADAVERAAALLPLLTERLRRHELGEIEVRQGDFRIRVSGAPASPGRPAGGRGAGESPAEESPAPQAQDPAADERSVTSPAVGFFLYAEGLGPGREVGAGDPVGHVEMLGVRHPVRVPRAGRVSHLVAERGEAVEYGQVLIEVEPAAGTPG